MSPRWGRRRYPNRVRPRGARPRRGPAIPRCPVAGPRRRGGFRCRCPPGSGAPQGSSWRRPTPRPAAGLRPTGSLAEMRCVAMRTRLARGVHVGRGPARGAHLRDAARGAACRYTPPAAKEARCPTDAIPEVLIAAAGLAALGTARPDKAEAADAAAPRPRRRRPRRPRRPARRIRFSVIARTTTTSTG